MRYAHFAKICEKCGKVPNMRQSHIRVFLTWLTGDCCYCVLLALLWLRQRRVVLKHLDKLTNNLEKSKNDPSFELPPNTEEAGELCSIYCLIHCVSKKWHWCCRLYLQRTSTDFNSFWQVIARLFELSYAHLIFHVRLLLLPYFAASLWRRKWRILTSLVVCKHAVY